LEHWVNGKQFKNHSNGFPGQKTANMHRLEMAMPRKSPFASTSTSNESP
jgi:hypothetical protein